MSWTPTKTDYFNETQFFFFPELLSGKTVPEAEGINLPMVLPRLSSNLGCHFSLIVYFLIMSNWALFLFFYPN